MAQEIKSLTSFLEKRCTRDELAKIARGERVMKRDPTPDQIQAFIDEQCKGTDWDARVKFVDDGGGADDYTALWFLCSAGEYRELYDCIEVLLKNGADPNKNSHGHAALHSICEHQVRDSDIVELLIKYKADPNLRIPKADGGDNVTPLETLSCSDYGDSWNIDILEALLEGGARPEVFYEAAEECPEEAMELLRKYE